MKTNVIVACSATLVALAIVGVANAHVTVWPRVHWRSYVRNVNARLFVSIIAALAAVVVSAGGASAHVTVEPRSSTARASERYTVRAPTEKAVPTVKIRVEFPTGVTVSRFLPKAGWKRDTEKDGTGRLVAVTWSGGQIAPEEFEEFVFIGRNPAEAGSISWKAYQTYQDGETVEWIGPDGSDRPASITTLRAAPAGSTVGSADEEADEARAAPGSKSSAPAGEVARSPSGAGAQASAGGSDLPLFAGLAAAVLSVIALVLSGVALARRPAERWGDSQG